MAACTGDLSSGKAETVGFLELSGQKFQRVSEFRQRHFQNNNTDSYRVNPPVLGLHTCVHTHAYTRTCKISVRVDGLMNEYTNGWMGRWRGE